MKILIGILVLDRPKTLAWCLYHLTNAPSREQFHIVLIDNHSNDETQEVLRKYEKDVDQIIHNDWNVGYCFGDNQWRALREPGQHCVHIDQDAVIYSPDWWEIVEPILNDLDIGMIALRRPTAWIDRPDKIEGYKQLRFEKRHDRWLEVPNNNFLIAPILIYKGEMLDMMGFENEATGYGDLESPYRLTALGYKGVYIPDVFVRQVPHDFEVYAHPQLGAHKDLLARRSKLNDKYINMYQHRQHIYCGTRWLPETIIDEEYKFYSDQNWEFFKNWGKDEKYIT